MAVVCHGYTFLGWNEFADMDEADGEQDEIALGHLMHAVLKMANVQWPSRGLRS
jgi:hypothetical protein